MGKSFDLMYFRLLILVQMVLCFSNSFSPFIWKDINLWFLSLYPFFTFNVLTYPLILGNIKTNGLITSSTYPIKILRTVLYFNWI